MTSAAFATGPSDTRGAATAELRTAAGAAEAAPERADKAGKAAADKAAADKAADRAAADKAAAERAAADKAAERAAAERAAERAAAEKAAEKAAAAQAAARAEAKAAADAAAARKAAADAAADRKAEAAKPEPAKSAPGSAAGAVSGKSAATATTTNSTYVNGNTNSSKADRPNAPVAGSAPTQPLSKADRNGTGANPGSTCTHVYCSNRTGVEPGNGNDSSPAKGQPCAGCVGKADNKYPKGQAPGGSDHNSGYECDRNQGVGKMNPAHTGCSGTTTPPTTPTRKPTAKPTSKPTSTPTPKPTTTKTPGNGTAVITVQADCRTVRVTSSKDISNVVVRFTDGTSQKFDGLSGHTWTRSFSGKTVASATAKSATTSVTGTATGCGVLPTSGPTCPDGSKMPASGDVKDCPKPPKLCPDGSKMPASGDVKDCPKPPKLCPDGSKMPASGDVKDCPKPPKTDPERMTICHQSGTGLKPLEIDKATLGTHLAHGDKLMPANGVCSTTTGGDGGGSERVTICHQTGTGFSPLEIDKATLGTHLAHGDKLMPAGGVCSTTTTTPFDQCPNMAGNQPAGTVCTTGGNPLVDVCPDVPGMQQMGPCLPPTSGGGTTVVTPPGNGGGSPISGVTPLQPVARPVPVGPPVVVPQDAVPPTIVGTVTTPAVLPVAVPARPRALPFTGADAALLIELGALLLLAGGGVLLVGRRGRSARTVR